MGKKNINIDQRIYDELRAKTTKTLMHIACDNNKSWHVRRIAYALWKGRRLHSEHDGLYCTCCLMQKTNCICSMLNGQLEEGG